MEITRFSLDTTWLLFGFMVSSGAFDNIGSDGHVAISMTQPLSAIVFQQQFYLVVETKVLQHNGYDDMEITRYSEYQLAPFWHYSFIGCAMFLMVPFCASWFWFVTLDYLALVASSWCTCGLMVQILFYRHTTLVRSMETSGLLSTSPNPSGTRISRHFTNYFWCTAIPAITSGLLCESVL